MLSLNICLWNVNSTYILSNARPVKICNFEPRSKTIYVHASSYFFIFGVLLISMFYYRIRVIRFAWYLARSYTRDWSHSSCLYNIWVFSVSPLMTRWKKGGLKWRHSYNQISPNGGTSSKPTLQQTVRYNFRLVL